MSNVYGTTKALWHWQQMASLQRGEQPYPVHVEIILSDWCNCHCSFCAYRGRGNTSNQLFQDGDNPNPKRMIPTAKCLEIIDDCVEMGVKGVQFTGGGEPTMHPDFAQIAAYALDKGLKASLVTNGSMLKHEHIHDVAKRMTWVRISIDASTSESYCRLKKVHHRIWCSVEDGVCLLCAAKAKEKLPIVIGAGFVCSPDNWREMYDACGLYRSWGVDNVRLGLMFSKDGVKPFAEFAQELSALSRHTVEHYQADGFPVISRVDEKLYELGTGHPRFKNCWYQHFTTYIGGDQNVYRCCIYAYNNRGLLGSIKDRRFKELWDSSEKAADFSDFDAHGCAHCQFTDIISHIDDALEGRTAPPHVEFV